MEYLEFEAAHSAYMRDKLGTCTIRLIEFDGVPEVLGYAIVDELRGVCHWVYVKHPYRRQALATSLLRGVTRYTCDTKAGRKLAAALNLKFNPYLR